VLPSFLIVGPPRTGTSWLHEVLKHRVVLPRSTKETRFFDVHFHRGLRWYETHFPRSATARRVGEVAPTYFASPEARQRIKQLVPHAKIVCIFRDPVERVISLYRVKRAYGIIPWDFEEALQRDREIAESSRYATHLRAWLQSFGSERVLAMFFDDLRDQPQPFVDRLADFIDIPRFTLTAPELRIIHTSETMTHPRSYFRTRNATLTADWLKARRLGRFVSVLKRSPLSKLFLGSGRRFARPSPEAADTIWRLFRHEVEMLETMVNRDLSVWRQSQVQPIALAGAELRSA
jgi:sulfotransferase family protein